MPAVKVLLMQQYFESEEGKIQLEKWKRSFEQKEAVHA